MNNLGVVYETVVDTICLLRCTARGGRSKMSVMDVRGYEWKNW